MKLPCGCEEWRSADGGTMVTRCPDWFHRSGPHAPEPSGALELPELPEWAFRKPWQRFQFGQLLDGQLEIAEREELGFTDAEPDRGRVDPSFPDQRTTLTERTLPMSTTPTGAGTPTGSNPAGVASPTTPEETGNSDRTELRSVSTDGDRREVPLPSPRWRGEPGGPCELCGKVRAKHLGGGEWCHALPNEEASHPLALPMCEGGCGEPVGTEGGVCGRPLCVAERDRRQDAAARGEVHATDCRPRRLRPAILAGHANELRSVSTDENRRKPAPGDRVEVEMVSDARGMHWLPAKVLKCAESFFEWEASFEDGSPMSGYTEYDEDDWRWPVSLDAQVERDLGPLPEGYTFEAEREVPPAEVPAVRRCTVGVGGADQLGGGADVECGAILGSNITCRVCLGERCFPHCGGLEHFKGRTVSHGGAGSLDWYVSEIASGLYGGQIVRRLTDPADVPMGVRFEIVATVSNGNRSPDVVVAELMRKIDSLDPTVAPLLSGKYEPPKVRQVGRIDDATDQLLAATKGKLSDTKRAELVLEVIEWLRGCEEDWGNDIYVQSWDTIDALLEAAKKWHDRKVVELFSRLTGAL